MIRIRQSHEKKRILVLFPSCWDRRHFARDSFRGEYDFIFYGEELWTFPRGLWRISRFDPMAYIDEVCRKFLDAGLDGVLSTDEYVGNIVATAVAERLGLPSGRAEHVLRTSHKYYSRGWQRSVVPDAVPRVQLIPVPAPAADSVRLDYPFFVKPVRGSFSMFSARIDDYAALKRHLRFGLPWQVALRAVLRPFNEMFRHYFGHAIDANRFIAEELLVGQQVCVDGFAFEGEVTQLGVVDARFFPRTHAFERFQYPSSLSESMQARVHQVVEDLIVGMGIEHGPFNVELVCDEKSGHISVLELHPRISYQFADLYEDVDGTNTYDLMLDLTVGRRPQVSARRGNHETSASLVIRKFHGRRVTSLPDSQTVQEFVERNPTARVELFATLGNMNPEMRAMGSYRCALINVGGCHETIARTRRDADASLQFDVS